MTVQQAIRILDAVEVRPRVRRVALAEALGLRLAQTVATDRDYPPFDKSQMDGFAIRQADVVNTPAELQLIGEVAAGESSDRMPGAGETIAIMTGAPLPPGTDAVVPVEDAEKLESGKVRILRVDKPSRFVAARGSDARAGQVILKPGTRIGPAQIAVAATVGAAEIDVFERPGVAVLSTGDELVPIDREPGTSQIRNANSPMLLALLRRMGCDATDLGVAEDDPEIIREALKRGLGFDALFVTGGMSMGEYDYVPRLLIELGVDLKITKLRIKPGKPFVFGVSPSCFVFGLPGNPVSAFVCASRLASRVITRLAGGSPDERWLTGRLDAGLPVNGPREFYQPAVRTVAPGRDSSHGEFASITPLKWVGSADLFTLARANVLIVRPENDPPLPKGTVLRVLEI
jgi:molybdopterin molybdotransferase